MKARKLIALVLALALVLGLAVSPAPVRAAGDANSYISDLIGYYKDYQEAAETDIQRTLEALAEVDPGQAEAWEQIMACIILKEPGSMTVEEMTAYIKASMARHKVPRYIEFVDSFPMNAAGKILKYKMRQDFAQKLGLVGDGSDTAGPADK